MSATVEALKLTAAPIESYSAEDQAFFAFWYGHMLGDLMQPPLCGIDHATARYIWDEAIAAWSRRAIPDTHVVVPREPTPEMLKAGRAAYVMCLSDGDAGIQYRAMITAAAPSAEQKEE